MKLKFRQIQYPMQKSIVILIFVALFLFVIGLAVLANNSFSGFSFYKNLSELEKENKLLRNKLSELTSKYAQMNKSLSKLIEENNYLRLSTNLPPLSEDEIQIGTGGKEFDLFFKFKNLNLNNLNELTDYIDVLSRKLSFEKTQHEIISEKLKQNELLFASIPAIKPCEGVIGTNGFGMREHPILGINKLHEGIDIITDVGTKVLCPGNGVVTFVGVKNGFGLCIEIEHYGNYKTVYAHLSGTFVHEGQKVNRGKVIGLTGNSGLSTGPHLHYEVHNNGVKLDPTQFFFDDLVLFEQKNKK